MQPFPILPLRQKPDFDFASVAEAPSEPGAFRRELDRMLRDEPREERTPRAVEDRVANDRRRTDRREDNDRPADIRPARPERNKPAETGRGDDIESGPRRDDPAADHTTEPRRAAGAATETRAPDEKFATDDPSSAEATLAFAVDGNSAADAPLAPTATDGVMTVAATGGPDMTGDVLTPASTTEGGDMPEEPAEDPTTGAPAAASTAPARAGRIAAAQPLPVSDDAPPVAAPLAGPSGDDMTGEPVRASFSAATVQPATPQRRPGAPAPGPGADGDLTAGENNGETDAGDVPKNAAAGSQRNPAAGQTALENANPMASERASDRSALNAGAPQQTEGETTADGVRDIPARTEGPRPAPAELRASTAPLNPTLSSVASPPAGADVRPVADLAARADAPTARTPGHPAAQQIAMQVSRAVEAGQDRLTVNLRPAELGSVSIKLEVGHDNRVIAVIQAERADTLDLLQRDARSLERALAEAGLETDSGSLSFSLQDSGDGFAGSDDGEPGRTAALTIEDDDVRPTPRGLSVHAPLADGSGVDINV